MANPSRLIEQQEPAQAAVAAAAAPLGAPQPAPPSLQVRRFDLPDLDQHGFWLLPRLRTVYPHLNDRSIVSWLRSILYSSEFMFLYSETGAALAQCVSAHTLQPKPVVEERFVWIKDQQNVEQQEAATEFYVEFSRWAAHHGAEVLVVDEQTDVPHEMIGKRLGQRVFTRQQRFVRV